MPDFNDPGIGDLLMESARLESWCANGRADGSRATLFSGAGAGASSRMSNYKT